MTTRLLPVLLAFLIPVLTVSAQEAPAAAAPANRAMELNQKIAQSRSILLKTASEMETRRNEFLLTDETCMRLMKEITDLQAQINDRREKIESIMQSDAPYAELHKKRSDAVVTLRSSQAELSEMLRQARADNAAASNVPESPAQ